jgi:virulence-associated protein VapD
MMEQEFIEMARRCLMEIKQLRQEVETLRPRARAYDDMSKMLAVLVPQQPQGYGEDVAWILERRIREVENDIAASKNEKKANDAKVKVPEVILTHIADQLDAPHG